MSSWRGVPGMPHWEEALGKTQDTLERLCLSAGPGHHLGVPSGRAGGSVWGEGGEDSFKQHSVDLELEAVEKQFRDLQVKQAQLRQWKAALESSRTDAHLSEAQRKDVARPGFVHSGAGVARSLDAAAAAEDASQTPGEDLSPSAATRLRDLDPEPLQSPSRDSVPAILKKNIGAVVLHASTNDIGLRQTEILKKDFRSLVEKVRTTSPTTRIIVSGPLPTFQQGTERFYRPDGLHPSTVGAAVLSDNISRTLRTI
ncbi:hypothetical protein QTP70_002777 [Hemibagrus guttatus]|uniref:SGNH hydrolase-type esterase domain-containing protein n=1 Tax=Hemibagrus guttatus TaxID=175788 RepID=A0AAE0PTL9_9TELE|nr:hypothetical protein QTP70_002777 [Hemibagrus guttatus]